MIDQTSIRHGGQPVCLIKSAKVQQLSLDVILVNGVLIEFPYEIAMTIVRNDQVLENPFCEEKENGK